MNEGFQFSLWNIEPEAKRQVPDIPRIENDEYTAPADIFKRLDDIYHFNLDVCATSENTKCLNYYDRETDGLKQRWHKAGPGGTPAICWMHPPYIRAEKPCPDDESKCTKKACKERRHHIHEYQPGQVDWVRKAWKESRKGCLVVSLIPARTDTTEIFHKYIWDGKRGTWRHGVKVDFIEGRVQLEGTQNMEPYPTMIVIFEPPKKRKARKKKST